ncbi:transcription-repair coupling factor [Bacillus taeanensis]|uniref:Transcription-repair-coupling factor n=1 Tax=Bacillus taeanensis TaxID=273032 RepID=A0A366XNE4_9BACI|nr:transcription-repair coupling factor [Bacillus taeanensis]RBW67642.1 transcription-repair coupling factor [Bacillus taeanensis]
MLGLRQYFSRENNIETILSGIEEGLKEQLVTGLSGSARTLLTAAIYEKTKHPQLILTHNLYQAQKIYEDLSELVSGDEVFMYPVNELISSDIAAASPELKSQRVEALNYWSKHNRGIIIAPIAGVKRLLPPKSLWQASQYTFQTGTELHVDKMLTELIQIGYTRVPMVASPGEFSMRGGIIDIYPLTEEKPLRIELFDTEIDSIRYFEIETQRSDQMIETVTIGPAEEVILRGDHFKRGKEALEKGLHDSLSKIKDQSVKKSMNEKVSYEIERLGNEEVFQGIYKYTSLLYEHPESLLDYLPKNGLVVFDEISRIQEMSVSLDKEEAEWLTSLLHQGDCITDLKMSASFEEIIGKASSSVLYLSLLLRHVPHTNPENIVNVNCKAMQDFHGQMNVLKAEVERWLKGNFAIVFFTVNKERAKRLERVLADQDIESIITDEKVALLEGKVQIMIGDLSSGFEMPIQKLAVITEEEVFTKKARKPRRNAKLSNAERIKSYSELKVGDYIVHVNHGIGKYLGIETLEINGIHKDYLHVKYAGNDTLYVPVEQIDQVQKYVGSEAKEPKIYALGGNDWKKVKKRVKSSVENIADDLIKLYAEREASKGFAFPKDGLEQQEFESAFPYQETEDQLRAIEEIKVDMQKERPMDRLLCGDVGYGKTEVAIRAAFKAIMAGKQVALLVPTTILAQQHYETISERFSEHPINIGLLSRFRTRKEQNETIKGLKEGVVDIVIGTHRLLSKDLKFQELGLLIVDEEQRFGVTHKEKIKKMKANVDVLTLTATPIPRTLHMSMLGVRDLSVIETPPENRFPVQTYVAEYNPVLVRESIERELARNGQVYFLYNRVETIQQMTEQISALVPDARVAYAHGQMSESELEAVMLNFLEGEYDVLVSTTIIETGVDIPNVNTLIVYNADKMGLSQLYQLRGRVGRSNRVAYAYFTYQKDKVLSEEAEKRLQAIKEFTELGSGFKIAMRDLTIRGAGNLLGAEQHGFIDSVGFDLYSQMLKEAIEERRGDSSEEKAISVEVDLGIDAYIPAGYISDERQKIDMYKRFKSLEDMQDIYDLKDEMIDRFGMFPEEVEYLFSISRIKVMAKQAQIESVVQKKQEVTLLFTEKAGEIVDIPKLFEGVSKLGRDVRLGSDGEKVKIVFDAKKYSQQQLCEQLETILETAKGACKETVNS